MNLVTIIDRIKKIKNLAIDAEIAEILGMSRTALAERKRRNSIPFEALFRFAQKESISLDWLLTGKEEIDCPEGGLPEEECVKVNVYALAGAKSAKDLIEPEPVETISIYKRFFVEQSMVAVKVKGESMIPSLYDGAVVGVDKNDLVLVSGRIYAVWIDYEGAVLKRLYPEHERILLKTDNPLFPSSYINIKDIGERFVLGRVKWVVQNL